MHALSTIAALTLLPAAALAAPAPVEPSSPVRLTGQVPSASGLALEDLVKHSVERLSRVAVTPQQKRRSGKKAKRDYKIPLQNQIEPGRNFVTYSGPMKLGTPYQDLSANGYLDTSRSRSFRTTSDEEVTVVYGGGSTFTGTPARERISVGGLGIIGQEFLAVSEAERADSPNWSGVLGLQYHGASNIGGSPFLSNLISNNALPEHLFSLYFSRTTNGSELLLGGIDSSHYSGDLLTFPGFGSIFPYWTAIGRGYDVNGTVVDSERTFTVFDSGTSASIIHKSAAAALYAQIPGSQLTDVTVQTMFGEAVVYQFPCVSTASVGLAFEDANGEKQVVRMNAQDLILQQVRRDRYGGVCYGAFLGLDYQPLGDDTFAALLGGNVHRSFYTVYSYGADGNTPSISLATSK
ncbi:hypothetical protein JCM10213v2_002802 [Rhodosporidiobolus nylandii]